jgi:hypothetical protein
MKHPEAYCYSDLYILRKEATTGIYDCTGMANFGPISSLGIASAGRQVAPNGACWNGYWGWRAAKKETKDAS